MSEPPVQSNNLIGDIISKSFVILFPLAMIAMLGVVGLSFYFGMPKPTPIKSEAPDLAAKAASPQAVPAAATPANPAAPAPGKAGGTPPAPGAAPGGGGKGIDPAQFALGKTQFALCAACHGVDGKGLQAGPAKMAPPLVGSKILLGDPELPLLVVLKGIQKENMKYLGLMAPLAAGLDDEKLAAVLTYVRNEWGNSAPAVTVEEAKAARAKFSDVNAPAGVKRLEIEKIVAAHK